MMLTYSLGLIASYPNCKLVSKLMNLFNFYNVCRIQLIQHWCLILKQNRKLIMVMKKFLCIAIVSVFVTYICSFGSS